MNSLLIEGRMKTIEKLHSCLLDKQPSGEDRHKRSDYLILCPTVNEFDRESS